MEYILKDLEDDLRSLQNQLYFLLTSLEFSSKNIEDLNLNQLRKLKQVTQGNKAKSKINQMITEKLIGGKIDELC